MFLAQGLSLQSKKAYPKRNVPERVLPHAASQTNSTLWSSSTSLLQLAEGNVQGVATPLTTETPTSLTQSLT